MSSLCGPHIERFIEAVDRRKDLPEIQIIGGNGSEALRNPATIIEEDIIIAPANCDLSTTRDNGTLRDMDTLVLSSNPDAIARVREVAELTVSDNLEISVFGLKDQEDLEKQGQHPVKSLLKVWLGDRYVFKKPDPNANTIGYKALYPFAVPIEQDFLSTYQLEVGDSGVLIPTSHPGATILNYLTRSVSGLRPKDEPKVIEIANNILPRYPEIKDWMLDGPGKPVFDMARVLHTIRESRRGAKTLHIGENLQIDTLNPDEMEQTLELFAHKLDFINSLRLAVTRLKARGLHIVESQETVVACWQRNFETKITPIIHND